MRVLVGVFLRVCIRECAFVLCKKTVYCEMDLLGTILNLKNKFNECFRVKVQQPGRFN